MTEEPKENNIDADAFKFQFEGERFICEVIVDGKDLSKDTHLLTIEFIDDDKLIHIIIRNRRSIRVDVYCEPYVTDFYYDEISNNVRILRSDARENEPRDISFSLLLSR